MTTEENRQPTAPSRHAQSLLHRTRAFDTRHPRVWDTALTSGWTLAALVDASGGWRTTAEDPSLPVWLIVTLSLALALPLYERRRHPLAALTVMTVAATVSVVSGASLQAAYLQAIPLFHIALTRPSRTLLWSLPLLLAPLLTTASSRSLHLLPTLLAYALVALLGIVVRSRRDHAATRIEQETRLAAAAERTRIAREMHDIIGHNLSVITGLADGGRYAAKKNPDRAAQALDAIATTSRQALADLRRLLDVLKEDEEEAARTPQPTLDDLDPLLAGVREAGLPVTLRTTGTPPAHLSAGAHLTVYRVVQEALTNTLKHAGPTTDATVHLTYAPKELTAAITNTPGTAPPPSPPHTPGRGITGMRDRAALYDGTLDSGPLPDGGWQVRLRLPLKDTPT
ncbi:sensor histidine kinase [Streptomyces sp. NPDC056144]|uniref:sensor histidine kinase n=1 Tax=unclassified Streptomyces TaxID=2593676 RepID=UPI0035E09600